MSDKAGGDEAIGGWRICSKVYPWTRERGKREGFVHPQRRAIQDEYPDPSLPEYRLEECLHCKKVFRIFADGEREEVNRV